MKIRTDFVTNSSSSSFVLAFASKEDGMKEISEMNRKYGSEYVNQLLFDFYNAEPIENVFARFDDDLDGTASYLVEFGSCWSEKNNSFVNKWRRAHPDANYCDVYESKEFADECAKIKSVLVDEMKKKMKYKPYVVELEYDDHTGVGNELEHYILPECDFVVKQFSHH